MPGSGSDDVYVGNQALYHSTDHGMTWIPVALPPLPQFTVIYSIWGTSAANMYAVGAHGVILHLE